MGCLTWVDASACETALWCEYMLLPAPSVCSRVWLVAENICRAGAMYTLHAHTSVHGSQAVHLLPQAVSVIALVPDCAPAATRPRLPSY